MNKRIILPHLGQRIMKTSIAIFICLLLYGWVSRIGWNWSVTDACVAVIICIQPYKKDSWKEAINRFLGVLLGDISGLLMLLLLWRIPNMEKMHVISYLIMAIGIGLAVYICVALGLANAAGLCAIIYICIVATYPAVNTPFETAWNSLVGTTIGLLVAYAVEIFHFPGERHPEYIFFLKTQDLVPDRYAHVASNIHVILNRLFDDGAKICLTTRWAPAYLMSQMGAMNVNVPAIVIDGAAVYDIQNNKYLDVISVEHEDANALIELICSTGHGCAVIAIRDQSLLVYRYGNMDFAEEQEYKIMKRSPYRNYVNGTIVKEDQVAAIRVMAKTSEMDELEKQIREKTGEKFRIDRRKMPGITGYEGLYFTHPRATVEKRKKDIVERAIKEYRCGITPVDVISPYPEFVSEREALHLLSKVKMYYEPNWFTGWIR